VDLNSRAAFYHDLRAVRLRKGRPVTSGRSTDPDYLEAHASYGGILLDTGEVDEAIRQLTLVLQRQPAHAMALTMMAQAYRFKELFAQSVDAARQAIKLNPKTAEPHLWLADSLRLSGKFADARPEYIQYLNLSDFDSKLAGQLNYWVLGSLVGFGKRTAPANGTSGRTITTWPISECANAKGKPPTWTPPSAIAKRR
jgi:tetratricopeptide (TPR) repeat protein